jgi:hypothetical protein
MASGHGAFHAEITLLDTFSRHCEVLFAIRAASATFMRGASDRHALPDDKERRNESFGVRQSFDICLGNRGQSGAGHQR